MWPFKKDAKPELAPYKPSNPRPCWCGSVDFREAQGLGLEKWCADCGTVYMGVGNARNPCGAEDRRKSDSQGGA